MKKDRVYIIPTYYGLIYGCGIIVCVLAAAIYANNLAYMLCFFLLALFVMGMHQSNSNLKKIRVQQINLDLTSDDSLGTGIVWLKSENPEGHVRMTIKGANNSDLVEGAIDFLHPRSMSAFRLKLSAKNRGHKVLRKITLSSRYPFGLFYVWKVFEINQSYDIYPSPDGDAALPTIASDGSAFINLQNGRGEDFRGHKPYEEGESQRRIDWKAYARGRPLLVKEFDQGEQQRVVLPLPTNNQDLESKLRQLSQWIFECEKNKYVYAVVGNKESTPFGLGPSHKDKALRILARVESAHD